MMAREVPMGVLLCLLLFSCTLVLCERSMCQDPPSTIAAQLTKHISESSMALTEPKQASEGILEFFYDITGPSDVVILLETSDRSILYLRHKPIVEAMLRYNAKVAPQSTRIALITYGANSAQVKLNGISDEPFNKCHLLGNNQENLWSKIAFETEISQSTIGIVEAFSSCQEILLSNKTRSGSKKVVLLVSQGDIGGAPDFPDATRRTLMDAGISVYVMTSAPSAERAQALATNASMYATDLTWLSATRNTAPLISFQSAVYITHNTTPPCSTGSQGHCNILTGINHCICDNSTAFSLNCSDAVNSTVSENLNECLGVSCKNGGTCVDGVGDFLCWCPLGYHGRYCQLDQDECALPNVCEGNATCSQGPNYFECTCSTLNSQSVCGCFCEKTTNCSSIPQEPSDVSDRRRTSGLDVIGWVAIVIPVVLFVAIIIIGSILLIRSHAKKKKREKEKRNGQETLHRVAKEIVNTPSETPHQVLPMQGIPQQGVPEILPAMEVPLRPLAPKPVVPHPPTPPPVLPQPVPLQPVPPQPEPEKVTTSRRRIPPVPDIPANSIHSRSLPRVPEPPQSRPDILRSNEEDDDNSDIREYENLPVENGMATWMEYICDIIQDGSLQRACLVQLDRSTWIASAADFLFNLDDIVYFSNLLDDRYVDIQVKLKGTWYQLVANDGISLECVTETLTEVLLVARTKHHMILGTRDIRNEHDKDKCRIEIDWIRTCIKEQGG